MEQVRTTFGPDGVHQSYVLALLLFQLSVVQDNLPANANLAYVGLVPLPPLADGIQRAQAQGPSVPRRFMGTSRRARQK